MFPFGHFDDLRSNDLAVEIKPPDVNERLDDGSDSPTQWSNMDSVREVERRSGSGESIDFVAPKKQLIGITPMYNRVIRGYFLKKVGQVLRLIPPPVMWIVVKMNDASMETADILLHSWVMYRRLVSRKNLTDVKDRGVHQRNAALEHIGGHRLDGIMYFADDDNVYTPELFDRLREIGVIVIVCHSSLNLNKGQRQWDRLTSAPEENRLSTGQLPTIPENDQAAQGPVVSAVQRAFELFALNMEKKNDKRGHRHEVAIMDLTRTITLIRQEMAQANQKLPPLAFAEEILSMLNQAIPWSQAIWSWICVQEKAHSVMLAGESYPRHKICSEVKVSAESASGKNLTPLC